MLLLVLFLFSQFPIGRLNITNFIIVLSITTVMDVLRLLLAFLRFFLVVSIWREAILVQLLAFILPTFALLLFRMLLLFLLQVGTVPAAPEGHQQDYKDQHNEDNPHKVVSVVLALHGVYLHGRVTLTHSQQILSLLAFHRRRDRDAPLAVNLRIAHLRLRLIINQALACLLLHLLQVFLELGGHLLLILGPLVLEFR